MCACSEAIMKILVTGSAGHLGEALVRTLRDLDHEVVGLDILASPFTTHVGSIADPSVTVHCMRSVEVVLHAATLHKPHVATHRRQEFVDTNITGTLKNPTVRLGAELAARGGAALGLGVLFPPLALLPTIQLGIGQSDACQKAIADAHPNEPPQAHPAAGQGAGPHG